MAKNFNDVYIIKSKDGNGLLKVAPVGTPSDLSPLEELPETFASVGTISGEGLSISQENDGGESITDSDGDTVKNTAGTTSRSLTFTIWETGNPTAMGLVYHPEDIQTEDGVVVGYDESDRTPPPVKMVVEFETDTNKIGRRTYYNAVFQSRGEETINADGVNGRTVTYNLLKDNTTLKYSGTRVITRPAAADVA